MPHVEIQRKELTPSIRCGYRRWAASALVYVGLYLSLTALSKMVGVPVGNSEPHLQVPFFLEAIDKFVMVGMVVSAISVLADYPTALRWLSLCGFADAVTTLLGNLAAELGEAGGTMIPQLLLTTIPIAYALALGIAVGRASRIYRATGGDCVVSR